MSAARKRSMTLSKARERVTELEESTAARQARIEQVQARLNRLSRPDAKLTAFLEKLERRQRAELAQLEKLQNLLASRKTKKVSEPEESVESRPVEELETLHKSFEDLRANLREVKEELDNRTGPDWEPRVEGLERKLLRLHDDLTDFRGDFEGERQAIRRIQRDKAEFEESLESMRETVEEDVVSAVDTSRKIDDLEERLDLLTEQVGEIRVRGQQERSEIFRILDDLKNRLDALENSSWDSPRFDQLEFALKELEKKLESGPQQSEPVLWVEMNDSDLRYGPPAEFEPELALESELN